MNEMFAGVFVCVIALLFLRYLNNSLNNFLDNAQEKGYEDGYKKGYTDGYTDVRKGLYPQSKKGDINETD